jgi:acyl-CoA dehydrogenase
MNFAAACGVLSNANSSRFERRTMSAAEREAAGFWLMDVPEDFGGKGLGLTAVAVFWHEISRTTAVPAPDHSLFGPMLGSILPSLEAAQKDRSLDPVLAARRLPALHRTSRMRALIRLRCARLPSAAALIM